MKRRREERIALQGGGTTIVRIIVHKPDIETGIPYTPRGRVQPWEYPYTDMNVGDSFHIMQDETANSIVSSRVHSWNKNNPETKFSCRTQINDEGQKLTRIWRIK